MPEGHVIHRLAEELDHAFAGRTVAVSSPQGRFAASTAIPREETIALGKEEFQCSGGSEKDFTGSTVTINCRNSVFACGGGQAALALILDGAI